MLAKKVTLKGVQNIFQIVDNTGDDGRNLNFQLQCDFCTALDWRILQRVP